jgi:hypothetical protein
VSTLAEIEKAAANLSKLEKHELMMFLDAQLRSEPNGPVVRMLPPAQRAADLLEWATGHESGPGLPDCATGRDAIYN